MKILLINPNLDDGNGFISYTDGRFKKLFIMPSLTMPYIAALTPGRHEVQICDESLGDPIDYDSDADIIGITCVTPMAQKVYRVADRLRRRGVCVVLGGCHATILPSEAKAHADAVVVGDAEEVWGPLLDDFEHKRLKPFYHGKPDMPLDGLPQPRMELLKDKAKYQHIGISAAQIKLTRGCPNNCSVCPIPLIYKRHFRSRPVDDVIREIEGTREKYLYFCEDTITGDLDYARELFTKLIPLKKKWTSVGGLRFAEGNLPELARKSGCLEIFIGLETPFQRSLVAMNKKDNIGVDLRKAIKKIHDAGIMVTGGFLVGFDVDDKDVFDRILDFVHETDLDLVQYLLLLPIPHTPMYKKLEREGRLLKEKWWLYPYFCNQVVYRPRLMTPEELAEGLMYLTDETYKLSSIRRRLFGRSLWRAPRVSIPQRVGCAAFNLAYREVYRQQRRLFAREYGWPRGWATPGTLAAATSAAGPPLAAKTAAAQPAVLKPTAAKFTAAVAKSAVPEPTAPRSAAIGDNVRSLENTRFVDSKFEDAYRGGTRLDEASYESAHYDNARLKSRVEK
jgi:radical SAM superfamily enzyme YgiQ (UPF0313 family)